MTDEKRNTGIPSDAPADSKELAAKSRSEARAAQAATAQTASDSEHVTRSKRKADEKPVKEDKTAQRSRKKRHTEEAEEEAAEGTKPARWVQVRILPIYVRVILVIVLLAAAVVLGTFIGYSILGDGAAVDIFHKETWTHIFDIITGKEK